MATQITGADELRRRLRKAGATILPFIAPVVEQLAQEIRTAGLMTAPIGETGDIVGSSYVEASTVSKGEEMSARAKTGYHSQHAAYKHEGYHFGKGQVANPSKWFEHAAAGREQGFADAVGSAIRDGLQKLAVK